MNSRYYPMLLEDSGGPRMSGIDILGLDTHSGTSSPMDQSETGIKVGLFL